MCPDQIAIDIHFRTCTHPFKTKKDTFAFHIFRESTLFTVVTYPFIES